MRILCLTAQTQNTAEVVNFCMELENCPISTIHQNTVGVIALMELLSGTSYYDISNTDSERRVDYTHRQPNLSQMFDIESDRSRRLIHPQRSPFPPRSHP